MSTRNISWGSKGGRCIELTTLRLHVPIVLKSGSLNLLESYGLVVGLCRDCFTLSYTYEIWNSIKDKKLLDSAELSALLPPE